MIVFERFVDAMTSDIRYYKSILLYRPSFKKIVEIDGRLVIID